MIDNRNHDTKEDAVRANRLIGESSPYLLMHAFNPVNWRPWGEDAFREAANHRRLLIVSIGYSACHWCHVMEAESFSHSGVADIMNQWFVSIKVDREERPDVDQVYMEAARLLTGGGGWPLNVLCLPDGRPFFAVTYAARAQWISLLNRVVHVYREDSERLIAQADAVTQGLREPALFSANRQAGDFKKDYVWNAARGILTNWDFLWGGVNGAPKFPLPVIQQFLLDYHCFSGDQQALTAVLTTLKRMAAGGIHDQIGGGFARYSVDQYWKVPHFEKMLYDNAQLAVLYARAFQLTRDSLFRETSRGILDFVERELSAPDGGFYSSLDADSDGEEGSYYAWSDDEIRKILGNSADRAAEYYNITPSGNWEPNRNILFRNRDSEAFAQSHHMTGEQWTEILKTIRERLLEERFRRTPPALDDKIITSWNGMMIDAFVEAYRIFGDARFLRRAESGLTFLTRRLLKPDGGLYRSYRNGRASVNGFLDDYAFTIHALIGYYQAVFREEPLRLALQLTEYVNLHFMDRKEGMYFYTSDMDPELIARKMDVHDNVTPSSCSVMAHNCRRLGAYFQNGELTSMAQRMARNVEGDMARFGAYFAHWAGLYSAFVFPVFQIAVVGPKWREYREELDAQYLPGALFSGGPAETAIPFLKGKGVPGKTMIYICRGETCLTPADSTDVALALFKQHQFKDL